MTAVFRNAAPASAGAGLAAYGLAHAVVDGICAAIAASAVREKAGTALALWCWVVTYDTIAFSLQVVFGHFVDRWRGPRAIAIAGSVLTGLGALASIVSTPVALCIAGLGNALFHAGGGAVSLNATPQRATGPGLFVAPGWLGLTLGTVAASRGYFHPWLFAALPFAAGALIFLIGHPSMRYERRSVRASTGRFGFILVLVLFAIAVRSLLGLAAYYPWKSDVSLLLMLAGAVVAGKAVGGILADRFGWTRVAVAALLLSAPLISLGADFPLLVIPGVFLFQMVMPITLAAVAALFPGRAGFSFGLASLALIVGAWPTFTPLKPSLGTPVSIFVFSLLSAVAVLAGLRQLRRLLSDAGGCEPVVGRL